MAASNTHLRLIFGTHAWGSLSVETTQGYLDILKKNNIRDLDTALIYPGSEKALGELGAPSSFVVHSKAPGFAKGSGSRSSILAGARQTFEDLKTQSIETYFVHSPDEDTPVEETVDAMQLVYAAGKYKHFGLSNFTPDDVRKVHQYAKSKGFVLPTVYQGNYNPVARHYDTTLLPLLRELKIAFYAYSPLAGGFLVKDAETLRNGGGEGRFDPNEFLGKVYHDKYARPSLLEALSEWESIANDAGCSKSALAYRWVMYNSRLKPEFGDGMILGASRHQQLEETLHSLRDGPLSADIAARIDKVWELVKKEAPIDNYHP